MQIYADFCRGRLKARYVSGDHQPEDVPIPRFDLLAKKQVVPISLEATRGCPFSCEFCALTAYGTRFHPRAPELVARDIREGQKMLRGVVPRCTRKMVVFCDNNIGGNPKHLWSFATCCIRSG